MLSTNVPRTTTILTIAEHTTASTGHHTLTAVHVMEVLGTIGSLRKWKKSPAKTNAATLTSKNVGS